MSDSEATPRAAGDGESAEAPATTVYEWAPPTPARRPRRLWLWIGAPLAAVVLGAGAASAFLIAPGTTIGGVPVGFLTPGAAAAAIQDRLGSTPVTLAAADGEIVVTGDELGASVEAAALADAAFSARPAWNVSTWFGAEIPAPIALDPAAAHRALAAQLPRFYTDPADASLAFDGESYVVTPGTSGEGVDLADVSAALVQGLGGDDAPQIVPARVEIAAATTTETAEETAARLNAMLSAIGFYVGDERTVPIDPETASSWIEVERRPEGGFTIRADADRIEDAVAGLPDAINRPSQDAVVITDTAGGVLREEVEGLTGRTLGSTAGAAEEFAAQIEAGDAAYRLDVAETPFATTATSRNIDVDLSRQRLTLYENGKAVDSWAISSGRPGHNTGTGSFRVGWKTSSQHMGNPDLTQAPHYYTKNVPWVMYFNGDEALHGAYWHNNFGTPVSAGCVNMPVETAKFLYGWTPKGTEVSVHY